MDRTLLNRIGFVALLLAGCAQSGPGTDVGTGGKMAGGEGGSVTGEGGMNTTPGTGGMPGAGIGGEMGTGGTTVGTGGDTGAGGRGTGGGPGMGGSTTGTGGRGTGGTTTGTGGMAAGTGGAAITPATIVPDFDGYYWEVTPSGNTALSGTNYPFGTPAGGCPTGASWDTTGYINTRPAIAIKGTTGQKYTLNINVRGVVGTRCYTGGVPGSTATGLPSGQNNTWYAGGKQYNDSIWNTMEIRVSPKVAGQPNQPNANYDIYFVNSFQNVSNWCQKEATYETRFDASFPVMGGGTLTLVVHDTNCRTLANCGSVEAQASCDTSASRSVSMAGVTPAPPANFAQPRTASLGGATYQVQWVWVDVTSVTSP